MKKIGFIGVGNMATAMINGILAADGKMINNLYLYDISNEKTAKFVKNGANAVSSIAELYKNCDVVVLSVKPQNFPEVLAELAAAKDGRRVLVISIGAGITTETVSGSLGGVPVVRALPNTPMLIGKGVSAVCRNSLVSDDEYDFASAIFESAGKVIKIDESEMNRIISVTSSSPAYVFMFIKAICDGATAQGLDGDALQLAVCNTVSGAAALLETSGKSAEELIAMVSSKGGTTERATAELRRLGFEEAIISAMQKCTDRADELGGSKK